MSSSTWRPRSSAAPEWLDWATADLQRDLATILDWARHGSLPAVYSCNGQDIWPSVGLGHSSYWERELRTGQSLLLDQVHRSAIRSRPRGGRLDIMADGAYWTETGRQFLAWQYVDPSNMARRPRAGQPLPAKKGGLSDEDREFLRSMGIGSDPATDPGPAPMPAREAALYFKSDVDRAIKDFVHQQTRCFYEDCLLENDWEDPPQRFLTWREFLAEYIEGQELGDGRRVSLMSDFESPAAKKIRKTAKANWEALEE